MHSVHLDGTIFEGLRLNVRGFRPFDLLLPDFTNTSFIGHDNALLSSFDYATEVSDNLLHDVDVTMTDPNWETVQTTFESPNFLVSTADLDQPLASHVNDPTDTEISKEFSRPLVHEEVDWMLGEGSTIFAESQPIDNDMLGYSYTTANSGSQMASNEQNQEQNEAQNNLLYDVLTDVQSLSMAKTRKRARRFTEKQLQTLTTWLSNNLDWPYPSQTEKNQLARQIGLTVPQVSLWFTRTRQRLNPRKWRAQPRLPSLCSPDPLATLQDQNPMLEASAWTTGFKLQGCTVKPFYVGIGRRCLSSEQKNLAARSNYRLKRQPSLPCLHYRSVDLPSRTTLSLDGWECCDRIAQYVDNVGERSQRRTQHSWSSDLVHPSLEVNAASPRGNSETLDLIAVDCSSRSQVIRQPEQSKPLEKSGVYLFKVETWLHNLPQSPAEFETPEFLGTVRQSEGSPEREQPYRLPKRRNLSKNAGGVLPTTPVTSLLEIELSGYYACTVCTCAFSQLEDLRRHEMNHKNRDRKEDESDCDQNDEYMGKISWSCSAILSRCERPFIEDHFTPGMSTCGFCGQQFPIPLWHGDEFFLRQTRHLNEEHSYLQCNWLKRFYRADHFRLHLKHSHNAKIGKWTCVLEDRCQRGEHQFQRANGFSSDDSFTFGSKNPRQHRDSGPLESPAVFSDSSDCCARFNDEHESHSVKGSSVASSESACSYTSFGSRQGRRLPFAKSNGRKQSRRFSGLTPLLAIYQCTFCSETFSTKYTWRRHEESVHVPQRVWICKLDAQADFCLFCDSGNPADISNVCPHDLLDCCTKPTLERTFYRKDALGQHLRIMHKWKGSLSDQVLKNWPWTEAVEPDEAALRCPFCLESFGSWTERIDHLDLYFRHRKCQEPCDKP